MKYILPDGDISPIVTKITCLIVHQSATGDRYLTYRGNRVDTCTIAAALDAFFCWTGDSSVLLVAHNCKAFDMRVFIRVAQNCGMFEKIKKKVSGFGDAFIFSFYPFITGS